MSHLNQIRYFWGRRRIPAHSPREQAPTSFIASRIFQRLSLIHLQVSIFEIVKSLQNEANLKKNNNKTKRKIKKCTNKTKTLSKTVEAKLQNQHWKFFPLLTPADLLSSAKHIDLHLSSRQKDFELIKVGAYRVLGIFPQARKEVWVILPCARLGDLRSLQSNLLTQKKQTKLTKSYEINIDKYIYFFSLELNNSPSPVP